MIGKRMEHRGYIDVDLIVSYIETGPDFIRWQAETIDDVSNLELRHQIVYTMERSVCGCPPMPRGHRKCVALAFFLA